MMKKTRWLEESRLRNPNENNSKNNNIGIIRSCLLSNVIMADSLCYVLVVVLMFSCLEGAVAKSLDVPMVDSVDRLAPPDHLDGIKMEQDGHLNKNFHKEVFLGDLEDFEDIPYEERRAKLDEVFNKADTNRDSLLQLSELEAWITKKLDEHFHEASIENNRIFTTLDKDKDGFLDWDEYLRMYLQARGYGKELIAKYLKYMNTTSGSSNSNKISDDQFFHNGASSQSLRTSTLSKSKIVSYCDQTHSARQGFNQLRQHPFYGSSITTWACKGWWSETR